MAYYATATATQNWPQPVACRNYRPMSFSGSLAGVCYCGWTKSAHLSDGKRRRVRSAVVV